jgi:hypothetical protein
MIRTRILLRAADTRFHRNIDFITGIELVNVRAGSCWSVIVNNVPIWRGERLQDWIDLQADQRVWLTPLSFSEVVVRCEDEELQEELARRHGSESMDAESFFIPFCDAAATAREFIENHENSSAQGRIRDSGLPHLLVTGVRVDLLAEAEPEQFERLVKMRNDLTSINHNYTFLGNLVQEQVGRSVKINKEGGGCVVMVLNGIAGVVANFF